MANHAKTKSATTSSNSFKFNAIDACHALDYISTGASVSKHIREKKVAV